MENKTRQARSPKPESFVLGSMVRCKEWNGMEWNGMKKKRGNGGVARDEVKREKK
jgi:hypothetical protein